MTPLSQITQLGIGCGLGSTKVEVIAFVKTISSKPHDQRQWHFHIFKIADPETGFQCEAKFWDRDQRDIPLGQVIEIIDNSQRGPGLTAEEDNRKNVQLNVRGSCEIAFIQGATQQRQQQQPQRQQYQQPQPQPQQQYQQYQGGPQQRQQQPQQQRQYQSSSQQQNTQQTRPAQNLGVTVGMAINNACNMIKDGHPPEYYTSPAFSLDVWTIASDILRVSRLLEADKLADPVKVRHAPRQSVSQQHSTESQHDTNPDQAQQRLQNPPPRQQPQEPFINDGTDGDDIPF
jgi:hypothetical protein